ncbi:hypothetical protein AB0E83_08305 [Streptomyces sp. NPDC035033]|uniref:hypothetical protein n=1 Tax=Streptomyces sp. NPDC035033 TaxID=3155368 RepID=UPI0033C53D0F
MAVLALWGGALPLMAFQADIHIGSAQPHHWNLSAYEALGLDEAPGPALHAELFAWPWLLTVLIAQATLIYRAAAPHRSRDAPRLMGYVCAVALPLRLLVADVAWEPPLDNLPSAAAAASQLSFSFEGGWWLLHAGALLGLVAFVWQDIRARAAYR